VGAVLAEDLHNVTVRLGIKDLENVGARRQNLRPDPRDLDRRTERYRGFPVPVVCLRPG